MRRGFTLLEILVATGVGMTMMSLMMGAFVGIRKASQRSSALTEQAITAAIVNKRLAEDAGGMHHAAQVRIEVHRNTNAMEPGRISVTFLAGQEVNYAMMANQKPLGELTWVRWEWVPRSGTQKPGLYRSEARGLRESKNGDGTSTGPAYRIIALPEPRRDRRRDLDDNDGRMIPGVTATWITRWAVLSDGQELTAQRTVLQDNVAAFGVEFLTAHGWTIRATSSGITVKDAAGSTISPPGSQTAPWFRSGHATLPDLLVLDGVWVDGRSWTLPEDTTGLTAVQWRPQLLRVFYTLTNDPRPQGTDDGSYPYQTFKASLAVAGSSPL